MERYLAAPPVEMTSGRVPLAPTVPSDRPRYAVLALLRMTIHSFADLTWPEVKALESERWVALLPLGAVEAHGPHLPLATDGLIAERMVTEAARKLSVAGTTVLELPPISYSAAPFAAEFPGTISIRPEIITSLIVDIGKSLLRSGVEILGIANAHLDPAHLESIHRAVETLTETSALQVAFPDLTRRPWAGRLTDEFKSGACHAGQFETSIVMAASPDLVRDEIRKSLPPNPASLSVAIRDGKENFAEAGGEQAYFGSPAAATAAEGEKTIKALGGILADAIQERLSTESNRQSS